MRTTADRQIDDMCTYRQYEEIFVNKKRTKGQESLRNEDNRGQTDRLYVHIQIDRLHMMDDKRVSAKRR